MRRRSPTVRSVASVTPCARMTRTSAMNAATSVCTDIGKPFRISRLSLVVVWSHHARTGKRTVSVASPSLQHHNCDGLDGYEKVGWHQLRDVYDGVRGRVGSVAPNSLEGGNTGLQRLPLCEVDAPLNYVL